MSEQKTPQGDQLGGFIDTVNKNQTVIIGVLAGILIIVVGYVGLKQYYLPQQDAEAQKAIFQAQNYFEQDSFNLAVNGNMEFDGFLDIIDQYGMTRTGNLANYYAGISYLHLGDYDAAIKHLKAFDSDDLILGAMKLGALGDAYAEQGDLGKATKFYEDAAKYNDNEFTAPMYLFKAAIAKDNNGNASGALSDLKKIKAQYPNYQAGSAQVDKHIARIEQKL